jgi:hypothetical protein
VPRGYDENHPQAQFLKNKNWYLDYPVTDNELINTKEFIKLATRIYNKI